MMAVFLSSMIMILAVAAEEMCCQGDCPVKKEPKYYSINEDTCGESCFPNVRYEEMLTVDPNLQVSEIIYPCHSRGYTEYIDTVTYGEPPTELTQDLYKKPSAVAEHKCCEVCSVDGEEKYFSITQQFGKVGPWNCGEACMRPEDYDLYLKFELNLLPSGNSTSPCLDNGYDIYLETETHGAGQVQIALDMYTKEQ